MPSIYAHNQFGKKVLSQLPQKHQEIIAKYPRSFRIGLQGPDFLFFYRALFKNKVNKLGVKLHHTDTYSFMENAVDVVNKYGGDSAQYAYILGFICHFTLDNACHPFVNEAMKATNCGHIEIESNFDYLLLSKSGYVPQYYPMYKLVPTDYKTAFSIAPFYQDINVITIHDSLKWMRQFKKLFVAPGIIKRTVLDFLMRCTLHYKRFKGHIIPPHPNPKCHMSSEHLYNLFNQSVLIAVSLIENFDNAKNGQSLSYHFHKDFNGNQF